jgi:Lon protease-like protein
MPLPLHIFEPRYRKMVRDALRGDRVIGMTLLRPGWEDDYEGRPPVYPAGCAGLIERSQSLADGRFNIVLKGVARFRIRAEHDREPYRLATVEPLPEPPEDQEPLDAARARLLQLLERSGSSTVVVAQPELPHDIFVNALCQSLRLPAVDKQALLESDSLLQRYDRLAGIIEFHLLGRSCGSSGAVH